MSEAPQADLDELRRLLRDVPPTCAGCAALIAPSAPWRYQTGRLYHAPCWTRHVAAGRSQRARAKKRREGREAGLWE